jgi:predicted MFS family arabinose efflux permease
MSGRVIRLMVARLISDGGAFAAIFVGMWGKKTFRLHATPRQMAVSAALAGLSAIIGGLAAGVAVDRFGPRRVIILAEILVVPAALALTVPERIWPFIALVPLAGFAHGAIMTAMASFAPYLEEDEGRLRRTNVAIEAATSSAMIFGPAVGAVIAKLWTIDAVFVFDAITSVVAVGLLAGVATRRIERTARGGAVAELREGIRFAKATRGVRLYLGAGALIWFSYGAFAALEALFYRDVLHSGPALLGWVLSVFGGGLLAGSILLDRVPGRWINARALIALILILSAGEITYVATNKMGFVLVGNIIWGLSTGAGFPMIRTLIQRETPDGLIGRVMGSSVTLNRGAQLIPLIFVGALASAFGVQRVLVGMGALLGVVGSIGWLEASVVDRRATRPSIPIAPVPDIGEPATRGML